MKLDWKTCLRAGVTVVATYLTIQYWNILTGILDFALQAAMPLVAGCIVAYIVNILMSFYERWYAPKSKKPFVTKTRRPVCLVLAFVSVIVVVAALFSVVLPELGAALTLVAEKLPSAISTILAWMEETFKISEWDEVPQWAEMPQWDWKTALDRAVTLVKNYFGDIMNTTIVVMSSVATVLVTTFICIVFSLYLLSGKDRLCAQCLRLMRVYLGDKHSEKAVYVLSTINRCFHNYISGQCLEAVILGLLCFAGMLIFRFPYAAMVSALIGFTALIPIAGAYIGAIIGAFVIFTVSPIKALFFLVYLVILQQFEGNVIFPRVVGSSIGLPGIWVLAAVTIGSGLFGIAGLLLGVPLAASAYQLLREDVNRRELSKNT